MQWAPHLVYIFQNKSCAFFFVSTHNTTLTSIVRAEPPHGLLKHGGNGARLGADVGGEGEDADGYA